jgi:hypothetical protein
MFRPVDGGIALFLPGDDAPHGICPVEDYRRNVLPIISSPGGSERVLRGNIERCGLSHIVQIHYGDFRDAEPVVSGFVFCDALHDLNEIASNAPSLLRFLRPTSVLACHDIGRQPKLIDALREAITVSHAVTIDSLYVAEIA